jgi:D-glycero-D-manno-heptose 1,7-bisphosphate phosphatase
MGKRLDLREHLRPPPGEPGPIRQTRLAAASQLHPHSMGNLPDTSGTPHRGFPAVFLDRDGTLNVQVVRDGKPYPPASLAEFRLFPDVPQACADLAAAGYVLVVVTNQPDVGRGTQSQAVVEAMHARLRQLVPQIARVETCYAPGHGEDDPRRKPAPGMLLDAAAALQLDLTRSWLVGDRWRDIDCGRRAGVRTVFIDFGYAEELRATPDFTVRSFDEAARIILDASK